jgi:hypothetical protein
MDCSLAAEPANFAEGLAAAAVGKPSRAPRLRRPRWLAPCLCSKSAVTCAVHLARTAAQAPTGGAGQLLPAALSSPGTWHQSLHPAPDRQLRGGVGQRLGECSHC